MNIDTMQIDDLIEYLNTELAKGRPMKDIEMNDFNVNERVISKRLLRKGYKRIDNRYMINIPIKENTNIIMDNNSNNKPIRSQDENLLSNGSISNTQLENLLEIADMAEDLKTIIKEYHNSKNVIEVEAIELRPKAVTNVKQKMFKIDEDTLKEWDKFVENHKQFKVQQLISQAMDEFINKYK